MAAPYSRRPWDHAQEAMLADLVEEQGLPAVEVAERMQRPIHSIYSRARRLDIRFNRRPDLPMEVDPTSTGPKINVREMRELYRSGARVADIATRFSASQQTIRNWLRAIEEPLRPVGRPKKVAASAIPWRVNGQPQHDEARP